MCVCACLHNNISMITIGLRCACRPNGLQCALAKWPMAHAQPNALWGTMYMEVNGNNVHGGEW